MATRERFTFHSAQILRMSGASTDARANPMRKGANMGTKFRRRM